MIKLSRDQHIKVAVKKFAIGRYPVTFSEFDFFCEETSKEKPEDQGWAEDYDR